MRFSDETQKYNLLLRPAKVQRLKNKCLITIVSLLECNDPNDTLIFRIIRMIPLSVLTNNLAYTYDLYKKEFEDEYNENVFERADIDLDDSTKTEEYFELIIDNGFFIYSLMQLFLSNKKGKDMLYEDSEMNDLLNEFNKDESKKGSMFGEISALGNAILS